MARVQFVNPNDPEQPAKGVYRWYCGREGQELFTLYVGRSGRSSGTQDMPSTLGRGISHVSSGQLTSDKGRSLDTDFIVGSAVRYFRSKGYDCYWEHVCDDPDRESGSCEKYKPILQVGETIKPEFRRRKPKGSQWSKADVDLATKELNELFDKLLKDGGTCVEV